MPWSDGGRSGVYYRSGVGTETGNDFRPANWIQKTIRTQTSPSLIWSRDRKRFPIRQTESRNQSRAERTIGTSTSLSPSPIRSQSPNPTLIRSRDRNRIRKTSRLSAKRHFIFYMKKEERKKMTDFLLKKDSWLADYYLEGRHHIWRFIIFIFCIWISDVHSDLVSKSSSDRES